MSSEILQKVVIAAAIGGICSLLVLFRNWFARYRRKNPRAQSAFNAVTWIIIILALLFVLAAILFAGW